MIFPQLLVDNTHINQIINRVKYSIMTRGAGYYLSFEGDKKDLEKEINKFVNYCDFRPEVRTLTENKIYIWIKSHDYIRKAFYMFLHSELANQAGWNQILDDEGDLIDVECKASELELDYYAKDYTEQFIQLLEAEKFIDVTLYKLASPGIDEYTYQEAHSNGGHDGDDN
jgi:hypothetical protein